MNILRTKYIIGLYKIVLGVALGGHVRAVFTVVTFIFIFCVLATVTSFSEIPLWRLEAENKNTFADVETDENEGTHESDIVLNKGIQPLTYGAVEVSRCSKLCLNLKSGPWRIILLCLLQNSSRQETSHSLEGNPEYSGLSGSNIQETSFNENIGGVSQAQIPEGESVASLSHYLKSIIYMPFSLRMVCLTNLFCWMAHVCYSLYFTDFVGEAVFGGDPKAAEGSVKQSLYSEGVRFGCWGMAMYSLSCACYSLIIEKLIQMFG